MKADLVILICSSAEWRIVLEFFPQTELEKSPFGEFFKYELKARPVVFLHSGYGKIAAAASTQYIIDHFKPKLLVNLGTCGGFEGKVELGQILLAQRTVVYDILERMLDADAAIAEHSSQLDLTFIEAPFPLTVHLATLASADRDLVPGEIADLKTRYKAVAGDWESGAIAYVASRNGVPCLILRGVTDITGPNKGETDGNFELFAERTKPIMRRLLNSLNSWIEQVKILF
ncbi:MAG: 5'-methylthioadenosine/S-adenosylhomocysteine nucleosidase [Deltaproteobacteria bacterium]|nr:5'-methylthioadenosine/S-adenosylhomocysteine nucleosidase [Deltaproteobacteria bacterium]